MKKISRIALRITAIILALFILLNLGVLLFGKKIAVARLRESLKMDVKLGNINVGFPFSIKLSDLEVAGLARIKEVSLAPSILGLLAGKAVLSNLTLKEPVITLVQSPDGSFNLPQLEPKGKQPPVFIAGLTISNGTLEFIDQKIDSRGFRVILNRINFRISKVALPPTSLFTRFQLSADISDPQLKKIGSASGLGWIDFGPRDMDGSLKLKDVQITYFAPYYGNFISRKKLLSAKLNLDADLKAKADDLKIYCHLELADFIYGQEEPRTEKDALAALMPDALDIFTGKDGRVKMDFTIPVSLSRPRINILRFVTRSAQKSLARDPEKAIQNISRTVEQFKALGKSLKGIFEKKDGREDGQQP